LAGEAPGKQAVENRSNFQSFPLYANNAVHAGYFQTQSRRATLGKDRKTSHFNNGIVEVSGSIPLGSTNTINGLGQSDLSRFSFGVTPG
jgi:hypothetical protein